MPEAAPRGIAPARAKHRRNFVWDNRSDTATLRNNRGRFIDQVSWGYDRDRHHHGDNRR